MHKLFNLNWTNNPENVEKQLYDVLCQVIGDINGSVCRNVKTKETTTTKNGGKLRNSQTRLMPDTFGGIEENKNSSPDFRGTLFFREVS